MKKTLLLLVVLVAFALLGCTAQNAKPASSGVAIVSVTPHPPVAAKASVRPTFDASQLGDLNGGIDPAVSDLQEAQSEDNPAATAFPSKVVLTVVATDYSFSPSTLTVHPGDAIHLTLQNNGKFEHTFTIQDAAFPAPGFVTTKGVQPGQTDTIDFVAPKAGSYKFFCAVGNHQDLGMVGTLVVK